MSSEINDLEEVALSMALGQYLSSTHEIRDHETILEAFNNSDGKVLDELKVLIWEPFEKYPLAKIARYISDCKDSNVLVLNIVRDKK